MMNNGWQLKRIILLTVLMRPLLFWGGLPLSRFNHHPELLNRYRRVLVRWTSHSQGGVTAVDLELAATCDKLAIDSGLKARDLLK